MIANDKMRKKYFTEKRGMFFAYGDGVWVLGDTSLRDYQAETSGSVSINYVFLTKYITLNKCLMKIVCKQYDI